MIHRVRRAIPKISRCQVRHPRRVGVARRVPRAKHTPTRGSTQITAGVTLPKTAYVTKNSRAITASSGSIAATRSTASVRFSGLDTITHAVHCVARRTSRRRGRSRRQHSVWPSCVEGSANSQNSSKHESESATPLRQSSRRACPNFATSGGRTLPC